MQLKFKNMAFVIDKSEIMEYKKGIVIGIIFIFSAFLLFGCTQEYKTIAQPKDEILSDPPKTNTPTNQPKTTPKIECKDSDGELITNKGFVTYGSEKVYDQCEDDTTVLEQICKNGTLLSKTIRCREGDVCSDGICIAKGPDCEENDGGKNLTVKGIVTYLGMEYEDECTNQVNLKENYCMNDKLVEVIVECPAKMKCELGKCVEWKPNCVQYDDYVKLDFHDGQIELFYDSCKNNYAIFDYYCKSDGTVGNKTTYCETNQYCKNETKKATCENAICQEQGNAPDKYVAGIVTYGSYTYEDTCLAGNVVKDYFCSENTVQNVNMECPQGYYCSHGYCAPT